MSADPSDCPKCGEWRDSPFGDCANCAVGDFIEIPGVPWVCIDCGIPLEPGTPPICEECVDL